jgi:hypothetical protein
MYWMISLLGYFTLRNKSAYNLSDGSKPRWTIDVPKEILGLKNGKEHLFITSPFKNLCSTHAT